MNEPVDTHVTPAPAAEPKLNPVDFQFHGKAGEFFRIWIVNVCLTIITLGIYSAWAKVRTNQYFYGHTSLGDSRFEYTAQPMQILKGRLIAFGAFMLYQLIVSVMPILGLPILLVFALVMPWIIVRSLMFRHFNTRYRNIRLGFYRQLRGCIDRLCSLARWQRPDLGFTLPLCRLSSAALAGEQQPLW